MHPRPRRSTRFRAIVASFGILASVHSTPCWAELPSASTPRSVLVHVDSGRPVRLERQGAGEDTWKTVCLSPCDAQAPVEGTYRIFGSGVRASAPFTLDADGSDRLSIDVGTASKAGFAGGIVLASVSTFVALVGAMIWQLAKGGDISRSMAPTGIALAAGGIAGVATGIVLIVTNARTTETQTSRPIRTAWQPTWRDPGFLPAAPQQLMLPVVTF